MGVVLVENDHSGVLLIFSGVILSGLVDAVAKVDAGAKSYTATGLWLETGKVNFQNSTFAYFQYLKVAL